MTKVSGLKSAAVSVDGRSAVITFSTPDGSVSLEIDTETLHAAVTDLSAALVLARSRSTLSIQGVVHATGIRRTRVAPAEGDGETILLGLEAENGLVHTFAIHARDAGPLANRIREAVSLGRRQSRNRQ